MKVVHLTDLHVQTAPALRELGGKRLLGTINLYVLGRKSKFSVAAQEAAVETALREEPDVLVITGDLTAQALESEFAAARQLLDPLLTRFPAVIIPGNHDTYVREPQVGARMRTHFADWMGPSLPHLHRYDGVSFLAVETCRPHPLSAGYTPPEQLHRASALLQGGDAGFVFLCLHYPLRDRHGGPYGPSSRALSNAREVESWLSGENGVHAVLHGHEHHGFRTEVTSGRGAIPILNPGASGYALIPERDRTAHLNVYQVDGGELRDVRRLTFDGSRFSEEEGGAYATGR